MQSKHRISGTITAINEFKPFKKSIQFHKPLKPFKPYEPNEPTSFLINPNAQFSRPFCTKFNPASLSSTDREIAYQLVEIFTRDNNDRDPQLSHLGSKLTGPIVENVLNSMKSWRRAYQFFNWAKNRSGYRHGMYGYNAMAAVLSGARRNAELKGLAAEVVEERCKMSPGALGFFIRCLGSVGLGDEANAMFDRVKELGMCYPNNYTYCCLLEGIRKTGGLVELAETRLKEMVYGGWVADKYALTPMLQVYCKAGMFDKAWDVFDKIHKGGWVDSHVLSSLVVSLSKWGDIDRAFDLVERMEGYKVSLNEKSFFVLIHGFVSASKVDKAVELFEKMCRHGFTPDIAVYDRLIVGLCKTKDVEKALDLYLRMKSSGIFPDLSFITKLISIVNSEEVMVKLVEESGLVQNTKSMTLICRSILHGLVNNVSIDRAYHAIRTMMGKGDDLHSSAKDNKLFSFIRGVLPNNACCSIVIDGLCKNGRLDEAVELFRDMDRIRCGKSVLLYNNLIDALSSSQRVEECLELLTEMKYSGSVQPTHFTYNSIYGNYCRQGDVHGALHFLKDMRLHGHKPWIKHSTLLVQQLCKHGRAIEACDYLSLVDKEEFLPDIVPYAAALDGLVKMQKVDRALELFDDICARGYAPDVVTYNILINGLCKEKKVSEAQNILNKMLEKGLLPSVVTYNSLIDGLCKDGDIDQALACFSKMEGEEREPNVVTYTTLIDGLCNAGRPDDAVKIWNKMERKGCSPNRIAFMALISGLCKNDNPESALGFLREMEEQDLNADSFVHVALVCAFLSKRNPQLAFDILKEMVVKGMISEFLDKDHSLLKDTIHKLYEDPSTSLKVKVLLAEGSIPSDFLPIVTASSDPVIGSKEATQGDNFQKVHE
ncbi:putative pentatricopeptide repeat-containing protein [Drosera capensis]